MTDINFITMSEAKPKVLLFDIGGVCVSDSEDDWPFIESASSPLHLTSNHLY